MSVDTLGTNCTIVMWVAFVDFIAVLALRCNPIEFIQNQNGGPAVQLTEVTSCRRVRLCCQFYEHNNYLTSDAAKDRIVKFVTG